jgi:predicted nucleic acid-binding protein
VAGRFRTEDELILDALERNRQAQQQPVPGPAIRDPVLGCMREDAELMDEIVADAYRHRREETWREIDLRTNPVVPFDQAAAELAGRIAGELERIGQPIGTADPMIAATARHHGLELVTANTSHFQRIQQLGHPPPLGMLATAAIG